MRIIVASFVFVTLFISTPVSVFAADANLEISGWIPYWSASRGSADARRNLDSLDTVHPFTHVVKTNGELSDQGGLSKSYWKRLFTEARRGGVEIIPTVMSSDGNTIHALLTDSRKREALIENIVDMVEDGRYDGVDIDFEAKKADTSLFFSLFLAQLKLALGDKILTCAVEPRTPPKALYRSIPTTLRYSNDYRFIGTFCDRVEIMAYDQRRADLLENDRKKGEPYVPVADVDWVRKVAELTAETIPKEKLMLGVATYGQEYQVTVAPDWYRDYIRIRSINPPLADDIADEYDVTPSRNKAGEMSFSYLPRHQKKLPTSLDIPDDTGTGNLVAARSLSYANKYDKERLFNYVTWSDAGAIEEKVELAKELGLRGIAMFKIDGEEDRDIWDLFD